MRRMAKITGRCDDMLIVRGVNLFPSQVEELILRCPGLAPHYRIDVSRPHRLDEVAVHVELRSELEDAQGCARELEGLIKSAIGISARVTAEPPGALERSQGKAVRVRDLRPR